MELDIVYFSSVQLSSFFLSFNYHY